MSPDGWNRCKIGDIFTVARGGSPRPIDAYLTDDPGGINWIKIGDATASGKFIRTTKERIKPEGLSKTRKVIPGDFILSNSMSFGRPYIMAIDGCIHDGWLLLRPNDETSIDREFYYYLLGSDILQQLFSTQAAGSAVRNLNIDLVAAVEVQVPPLREQRRIAEILSSVDEAIAATRAVIEQTRKAKQGVLELLLTKGIGHTRFRQTEIGEIPEAWAVAPIEAYLARLIDYRGVPPPKSDSGVPLITAKNVRFGFLNPEPREYISEVDFDDWMRRGLPGAGDVLFTTEAPLGNVAQIPDCKIALGQRTITLCPDRTRLTPAFLKWLLLSPGSQARIAENATGSTALGIKQSTFRKLKFPFPAIHEQETIAEHIEGIAAAEAAEISKLESLKSLKAALMSDLLTGRKRVTDALPMAAE